MDADLLVECFHGAQNQSLDKIDFDAVHECARKISGTTALTFLEACGEIISTPACGHRQDFIKLQDVLLSRIQRDNHLLTVQGTLLLLAQFGANIHCDVALVTQAIGNLRTMVEPERCAFVFKAIDALQHNERGRDQLLRFLAAIVKDYWSSDMSEYASDMCTLLRFGDSDRAFEVLGALVDKLTPDQLVQYDVVKQVTTNFQSGQVALFFQLLRKLDTALLEQFSDIVPDCLVDIARVLLLSEDPADHKFCRKLCFGLTDLKVAWQLRTFLVANPQLLGLYDATLHLLAPLAKELRFMESLWVLLFDTNGFETKMRFALCYHAAALSKRYTSVTDLEQRAKFLDTMISTARGQNFPDEAITAHGYLTRLSCDAIRAFQDKTDVTTLLVAAGVTLHHAAAQSHADCVLRLLAVYSLNLKLVPASNVEKLLGVIQFAVSKVLRVPDHRVVAVVTIFLKLLGETAAPAKVTLQLCDLLIRGCTVHTQEVINLVVKLAPGSLTRQDILNEQLIPKLGAASVGQSGAHYQALIDALANIVDWQ